jgi:hypothetical protein
MHIVIIIILPVQAMHIIMMQQCCVAPDTVSQWY